jgi:hypothetical protein
MTRGVALLALAALAAVWGLPARASSLVDALIRANCISAIEAEVQASGNPSPEGMTDYTCDCVVEEFNKGTSIDEAIAICKEAAIRKYGV